MRTGTIVGRGVSSSGTSKSDGNATPEKDCVDGNPGYSISHEDFKWVERLFPPSRIPYPPKHDCYPTPSGWVAPSETKPDKPYFVRRTRYHLLPIYERPKPKRSSRWLTIITNIEGDIMALEKELVEVVRPSLLFDPATRVNEAAQTIWIKGMHKDAIESYLHEMGF